MPTARPDDAGARSAAEPIVLSCDVPQVVEETLGGGTGPEPGFEGGPPPGPTVRIRVAPGPPVRGIADARDLSLGATHGCASLADGTVRCFRFWVSYPSSPQGVLDLSPEGFEVPGLSGVTALASGSVRHCALHDDGTTSCFVFRYAPGSSTPSLEGPTRVEGLTGVRQLVMHPADDRLCAVTTDGGIRCDEPLGLADVVGAARSQLQLYAVLGDGSVRCEGCRHPVPSFAAAREIFAGDGPVACAILADRSLRCWGQAFRAGIGSTRGDILGEAALTLSDVEGLSIGVRDTCALMADHTVRCWGQNELGQVGDGTRHYRTEPTPVCGLHDAVDIAVANASCALLRDGTVRCWGYTESATGP